jgi:hypothetical protein
MSDILNLRYPPIYGSLQPCRPGFRCMNTWKMEVFKITYIVMSCFLLMVLHLLNCVLKNILLFTAPGKRLLLWKNRIRIAIDVANALVSFSKSVI